MGIVNVALRAYEPFRDSVPGWRERQCDANRRQREDGKQTSPDVYRVDATPCGQVVNWAGQYECKAQKEHGSWMVAKVRDARYRRRKQAGDDGEQHQALMSFPIATPEKARTNKHAECEYISKANQKDSIGSRCATSKQPGLECHCGT